MALGAQLASSPADVADRVETVMASLPSLQISEKVATGEGGVIHGKRIKRFIDLSTTGSSVAAKIAAALAKKNIVQIDSPVSGGVGGANKGTLAVMVSGPKAEIEHGEGRARSVRQSLHHWREARHGADHEAREQLSLGHGDGRDLAKRS